MKKLLLITLFTLTFSISNAGVVSKFYKENNLSISMKENYFNADIAKKEYLNKVLHELDIEASEKYPDSAYLREVYKFNCIFSCGGLDEYF